jgi:PPOX class probable F420-dependent enzyme
MAAMTFRTSPSRMPVGAKNLADLYELPLLEWDNIAARLEEGVSQAPGTGGPDRHTCWLATINEDGSPHVTGVGALWVDDAFWFQTGEETRKSRNLARDPRCSLSLATRRFDLVVEGIAEQIRDPSTVARLADRWSDQGWPARVDESGVALTADFSAPSAGPPPWVIFRLVPNQATALQTVEPGGATQWRLRST